MVEEKPLCSLTFFARNCEVNTFVPSHATPRVLDEPKVKLEEIVAENPVCLHTFVLSHT